MSWQTIVKDNNLEVSVIPASKLEGAVRLDSDYYQVKYLKNKEFLGTKECKTILELTDYVKKGIFDISPEKYLEEGVPLIRVKDIKGGFLDYSTMVFISEEDHTKEKKTELNVGDIVFSKVGTVGEVAIIDKKSNFSQNVLGIKIKKKDINPKYLLCFLLSPAGNYQIKRAEMISVQPKLELTDIRELLVPIASSQFQDAVASVVDASKEKKNKSSETYKEAEQMLLKEINLEGYKGTDEAISVRNFSEALADNRFDAEYWQPDYDVIQNAIKKHKDGYDTFDNLFAVADKKATIEPEKEYLYAELADVNGAMGTLDNFTPMQGKELPSRGRMSIKKDDVVMSSLDGSLSKIALITSDDKNIIGSTGFFVLRKKEYEPEVAVVLLKSKPIQTLLERQGQGTILSAIPKSSLSRVVLPKLSPTIQKKIKELVLTAHKQKEEAKELLEKAKRAVEIFVEKDEKEAMSFIQKK